MTDCKRCRLSVRQIVSPLCAASIVVAQTSNISLITCWLCGSSHEFHNHQMTGICCADSGKQGFLALCWCSEWPGLSYDCDLLASMSAWSCGCQLTSLACLWSASEGAGLAKSVASALMRAQTSWMFSTSPDTSAMRAVLR